MEEEPVVEQPIVEKEVFIDDPTIAGTQAGGTFVVVLLRWVLAIGVLMAAILLRGLVSQTVTSLIGGIVGKVRRNEEQKKKVADALTGPISFTCVVGGVFLAGRFADIPDDLKPIFHNIIKSLLDVLVFWIVYDLIDPISLIIQRTGTGQLGEEVRKVLVDLFKGLVVIEQC